MGKDRPIEIHLSESDPLVGELLDELNEGLTLKDLEYSPEEGLKPEIHFAGELTKHFSSKYREYAVLEGNLFSRFLTLCVGTGTVIFDEVESPVKAIFIEPEFEEAFGYEEETSVFLENGEEYELYYLIKDHVEIQPVLRETVFLNKNPYPRVAYYEDKGPKGQP